MDDVLFTYDILLCHSQGNCGNTAIMGCSGCVEPRSSRCSRPQAWAKNVVSVGGLYHGDNDDSPDDAWAGPANAGRASTGPAPDDRVKPDVIHFYDMVQTTDHNGEYRSDFKGTSAATPIACGHFGLFFQMWADDRDSDGKGIFGNPLLDPNCDPVVENCVFKNRPHAAMAKAMMINTAMPYEFSWLDYPDPPGPPNEDLTRDKQGWGVPSIGKVYALARRNAFPVVIDETDVLWNFERTDYSVDVPPGVYALKATLVWTDPPGALSPEPALVNDLDLIAVWFQPGQGSIVYYGNYGLIDSNWSIPDGESDAINNVENIFVKNPPSGTWTVSVEADSITMDGRLETPDPPLDVDYALVVSLDFDCNGNGILDSEEIADESVPDCNDNGIPDGCDLESSGSADCNANDIPDECDEPALDPPGAEPTPVSKNRYISFTPGNPGVQTALRVTLSDLPEAFEEYKGCQLWVGSPSDVTESPGSSGPTPPTFKAAQLQPMPFCMDWGTVGVVHVSDDEIVPSSTYQVTTICNPLIAGANCPSLSVATGVWGDVAGVWTGSAWTPPNGTVDFNDVSAIVDKLRARPGAPKKAWCDVDPDVPNRLIDFGDVPRIIDAFYGHPYPFDGPDECP